MGAPNERGRPGAVDVPEQDPHAVPAKSRSAPFAAGRPRRDVVGRHRVRHGCPGADRCIHRASARGLAGRPQREAGTPPRVPAHGGHHRREQRDHRGADRRGEMGGAGVGDHGDPRPVQHRGQRGEVECGRQVEDVGRRAADRSDDPPGQRLSRGAPGERHLPAVRARAGPRRAPRVVRIGPGRRTGPRVHDHQRCSGSDGSAASTSGSGRRMRSRPSSPAGSSNPAARTVPASGRARRVAGHAAAGRRAASRGSPRWPPRSRARRRAAAAGPSAAVTGGTRSGSPPVDAQAGDPVDQVVDVGTARRWGVHDPGTGPDQHRVDAGQQLRGGRPGGPQSTVTRSAPAATARIAGPAASMSPMLSSRTTSR